MLEARDACASYVENLLRAELAASGPDVAKLSIALGLLEAALTVKDDSLQRWPQDLPQLVDACLEALHRFAAELAAAISPTMDLRSKVKAVADAVWSKLTGSFSKDVLHAQHASSFARLLLPGGANGKRCLDCAGVTTTAYALCHLLAHRHGHAGLEQLHMCIAEDHCFLSIDPAAGREGSVEVTADTAAKRGLPADEALWQGWLYAGGHPVVCSHAQVLAALVTSLNPSITPGAKGRDSDHLQWLQLRLLSVLRNEFPAALYPAATCALADLKEVEVQDAVEAAIDAGDAAAAEGLMLSADGDALALFEEAIAAAGGGNSADASNGAAPAGGKPNAGWHWYPHSYIAGYLCRRAELLEKCAAAFPGQADALRQGAVDALKEALAWAASGGDVLARFRFHSADEQLYKDVGEGTLESLVDGLLLYSKLHLGGKPVEDASLLAPLLTLWDGICMLFAGKAKPAAWLAMVLRAAKLFSPLARAAAADAATKRSAPMQRAAPLWGALKPAVLRPLFESADVQEGAERGGSKRQRR